MVEATLEPGVSVARVAQANGVNPNLIFVWRKQHREGRLVTGNSREIRLLPVTVTDTAMQNKDSRTSAVAAQPGVLHIDLPRGHVRIQGGVDTASLRIVLETLLQ